MKFLLFPVFLNPKVRRAFKAFWGVANQTLGFPPHIRYVQNPLRSPWALTLLKQKVIHWNQR